MTRTEVDNRPVETVRKTFARRAQVGGGRSRSADVDPSLSEMLRRARLAVESVQKELVELRKRVLQLEGGEPEPNRTSRRMAALTHNGGSVGTPPGDA